MCRELGRMSQGNEPFWDFNIRVQAKNSLLMNTTSHLNEEKLRHQLESGMDELLAARCNHSKLSQVVGFKQWINDVRNIDELMRAERHEFEKIAKAT
jgi:hypothetical protein